jgi:hypothetical protein
MTELVKNGIEKDFIALDAEEKYMRPFKILCL